MRIGGCRTREKLLDTNVGVNLAGTMWKVVHAAGISYRAGDPHSAALWDLKDLDMPAAKCGEMFEAREVEADVEQVVYIKTELGLWLPTTTRDGQHVVIQQISSRETINRLRNEAAPVRIR